ncbi:MAG TPA: 30S ribosomal protein THX [Pyrinomonadaceae bacterium]|nr:30S ribosomal protein THX [Pyrinomonadaceae bacterium]
MGKGDKRTRRGKIFAGSHGKSRPKHKAASFVPSAAPAEEKKPARKVKVKAKE